MSAEMIFRFFKGASMRSTIRLILLIPFLFFFFTANLVSAESKTFIKEYTYQASEEDSRNSCRITSLREVKRLLLEELGTYLESITEVQNFQLTKDQITTLTAGIVKTEIIDEKWDGRTYWLKSKIAADSEEVIKSIDLLRKDRERTRELEEIRKRSDDLLRENEILRKQLASSTNEKDKITYSTNIKELSSIEWFEKGWTLGRSDNDNEAINAFSKAIDLNPKYAEAYCYRGLSYARLENYDQAIKDCEKAIELNPKYAHAYFCRALNYTQFRKYNQAIMDYNRAIEIDPKLALIHAGRGLAYVLIFKYDQALIDLNNAIQLDPKLAVAYYSRGLAYKSRGNRGQAIEDMKTAAKLGYREATDILTKWGVGL
jgi:tetratricopeptide (TPR) repeat protein